MNRTTWPIVVLVLCWVGSWGCQQSPLASEEYNSDNTAAEGASCSIDSDCETFYRCLDGECSVPPAITGEYDDDTPIARLFNSQGQRLAEFYLELALTEEEQSRGLMYRTEMRDDWGMLFIYGQERHLSFWMKNTLIPLDMIFIDDGGEVVGVVHEAEPESEQSRSVGEPSRFVLEVNGGLAEEYDIGPGTLMDLKNVEEGLQPNR